MTTLLDLEAIEAAARAPMTFDRPKIHCTHDEERGHAPWCFACDVADRASRPVPFSQRGRGDVLDLIAEVRRLREERQGLREDVAYVGASCDRELTIDGVALRAARLSPTRHDVERLTRERDEAIALERERCAALVREIPACQPGAKATAARRWLDDRVAACVRAIVVDDETATCARSSVRDARERAKAAEADAAKARAELAAARSTVDRLLGVVGAHGGEVARLQFALASEAARHAETRAALRANLRCDECDDLATRVHADTASFCCDAHGVGEGWADTTHAAAVREALR